MVNLFAKLMHKNCLSNWEERFSFSTTTIMNILWHTFKVINGPGNKLQTEFVLTEMIFSQAHLPGKQSSSGCIYFVFLLPVWKLDRDQRWFKFDVVFSHFPHFPKWKMSRKMNVWTSVFVVCSGDTALYYRSHLFYNSISWYHRYSGRVVLKCNNA